MSNTRVVPRAKDKAPDGPLRPRVRVVGEGQRLGNLYCYRPELLSQAQMLSLWRRALDGRGKPWCPSTLHVYVHVPFCESRCRFCWYFSTVLERQSQLEAYVTYVERFVDRFGEEIPACRASNAYIGGGTPSILPAPLLERMLRKISVVFRPKHQFCVEANPGSLDEEKIEVLARNGVNRVSLGVQSFDIGTLKRIGRRRVPAERVLAQVRELQGRDVLVNLDLLLGLPGQSLEEAHRDLAQALEMGPDTVTLYRYQTNPGLPVRLEAPLRFSDALGKPQQRAILAQGYVVVGQAEGDDGCSVVLLRPGRRLVKEAVRQASWWMKDRLGFPAEMPIYQCFDRHGAHLLGLGVGAFSHLQGEGWFREVTSLGRLDRRAEPIFCGSPMSELEDGRLEIHRLLVKGLPVVKSRLGRWLSPSSAGVILRELEEGEAAGLLRERLGRFRLLPGLAAEQRNGFLDGLLPRLPPIETAFFREGRWDAAQLSRLENLLSSAEASGVSVTEDVDLRLIDVLQRYLEKSAAHWSWLALMGVIRVGESLLGARAVLLAPDAAFFQLDGNPPIGIFATDEVDSACCARTGKTAFIMCPRPDVPLSPEEERWLHDLVSLTKKREDAADSGPGS